jgi:hypothetical protein
MQTGTEMALSVMGLLYSMEENISLYICSNVISSLEKLVDTMNQPPWHMLVI